MHTIIGDSDSESLSFSSSSSQSSFDEEEVNRRITPYWVNYRDLIQCRGFHLDTYGDVKDYLLSHHLDAFVLKDCGYARVSGDQDDDALCPDPGLPDNLFRGRTIVDGVKIIVKAVHLLSREFEVIQYLSMPPLRDDPMNHCIPVLDLIEVPEDDSAFIVMEEWSSELIGDSIPCSLKLFLGALRQGIEHSVFMHKHHIAHLDISLRNMLTDYNGHYAYIDFELSRRFDGIHCPRICGYKGTEVPPECERGEPADPYKIDVWALAILMLRALQLTEYDVPELMPVIKLMLCDEPDQRPSTSMVLKAFDTVVPTIPENRLQTTFMDPQ